MTMPIAIFASGNGSNFQALVEATASSELLATIKLLVCDNPNAYVIERAQKLGIPTFIFNPKNYATKADFEKDIIEQLNEHAVSYIVLAGYMRLIGPTLLNAFPKKIINIHPSLLPSFPGKDAIGQAFRAGVKQTGITVHVVDEGMDTGPIIAQKPINIEDNESLESIEARIHELEHDFYKATLQMVFRKGEL
ncbi:phosphoribosylglycinamide formyltransferase [Bacillus sp. HMF5848]|uniref:phosphoribosylglycinamide formyltransferase n=1 Tax=Bacillus sp. HMF5848 TaxID=2495421 RepID=UPI000F7B0A8C|nr:phosphoribosylglycinamide formyltransferase [Bacillus sp. HMF5848]RSK25755.1 phosphoribosylglycinamide formyltransferase [Bacillus sp. HMF5848]